VERVASEEELLRLSAEFAARLKAGDLVLLSGPLGVGKTTFVRGMLRSLGWDKPVKSPTFNLISLYPTQPPVLHADLYRLDSNVGSELGLDDYLTDHLALIEWPDRLGETIDLTEAFQVNLAFGEDSGSRWLKIVSPVHSPPTNSSPLNG
jgi:tRNA threonylcarbamoyladenosine biosynthesis protein TsaE